MLNRLRHAFTDTLSLFLIPVLAAVLPWRTGFAWLKRMARKSWLYRDAVESAWAAARPYCPGNDAQEWMYRFRLLRLVDHTDTYLTLLHGTDWWQRHVEQFGEWPKSTQARVFLTYHWGAGNWIWRLMRRHGFHAYFLARRAQGRALGRGRVSHWYGKFRAWAIRRIGSRGPLFVGGSTKTLMHTLQTGGSAVGMLDLPARTGQRVRSVELIERIAVFPSGLAETAGQCRAGITLFSAGLDIDSGRRLLRIENLAENADVEEVMRSYAAHLERRLHEEPAHWQIWCEAASIFSSWAG